MSKDTDSVYIPKDAFIELTYTVNESNSKYCGPYLSGDCCGSSNTGSPNVKAIVSDIKISK